MITKFIATLLALSLSTAAFAQNISGGTITTSTVPTAGIGFTNATSGTTTVISGTGALGTPTVTLPLNSGGLSVVIGCGPTTGNANCANTAINNTGHIYTGVATLASNAAVITFGVAFTSTATYQCVANDITTRANPVQMISTSSSTATITNTTGASDVINYICVGY